MSSLDTCYLLRQVLPVVVVVVVLLPVLDPELPLVIILIESPVFSTLEPEVFPFSSSFFNTSNPFSFDASFSFFTVELVGLSEKWTTPFSSTHLYICCPNIFSAEIREREIKNANRIVIFISAFALRIIKHFEKAFSMPNLYI